MAELSTETPDSHVRRRPLLECSLVAALAFPVLAVSSPVIGYNLGALLARVNGGLIALGPA